MIFVVLKSSSRIDLQSEEGRWCGCRQRHAEAFHEVGGRCQCGRHGAGDGDLLGRGEADRISAEILRRRAGDADFLLVPERVMHSRLEKWLEGFRSWMQFHFSVDAINVPVQVRKSGAPSPSTSTGALLMNRTTFFQTPGLPASVIIWVRMPSPAALVPNARVAAGVMMALACGPRIRADVSSANRLLRRSCVATLRIGLMVIR